VSAAVAYNDVKRMLDDCAKGSSIRLATHSRVIEWNGKVYRTLPKFDNLELGHVRKMVRHLGIDKDCARRHNVI
jgi:hypothetical protein